MKVNGKCLCGQVSFQAEVDESKVLLCHCTDCQVQASTAFRIGALVDSAGFSMQGEVKEYCKIGSTGARRMQVFCPTCATSIYSYTPDNPAAVYSLRLGAVKELRQLRPALTPAYNSIVRVLELLAAGVQVRLGSDNIADMCSPSTTSDLTHEVFTLSAAIRYYKVDILARIAAGKALNVAERALVAEHLQQNEKEISKLARRWMTQGIA